jgi:Inner membrane protein YgaP-like, transmembrane domain
MNPFAKFMASPAGRIIRIVAGIVLVILGYFMHSVGGAILAVVGLVPLLAGLFDFCVFAPLFGAPMSGPKIRAG